MNYLDGNHAFIFDMDGLMLDSERIAILTWQQAAVELGYELSYDILLKCIGLPLNVFERNQKNVMGEDYPFQRVWELKVKFFDEYIAAHGIPIKAGLFELLGLLDDRHIKKAIGTSTKRIYTETRLKAAGLLNRFDAIITGSEVAHVKPEPDLFLEAAERLGMEPDSCVVLEDSPYGVEAARAAKMPVLVVPDLIALPDDINNKVIEVFPSLLEVHEFLLNY
jgi:HAD superfamily hydrolase (TIGR01509 family)